MFEIYVLIYLIHFLINANWTICYNTKITAVGFQYMGKQIFLSADFLQENLNAVTNNLIDYSPNFEH